MDELDRDACGDGGSRSAAHVRKTSSGRRRLPPAASASAPTSATTPPSRATACREPRLELARGTRRGRAWRGSSATRAHRGRPRVQRDDAAGEEPVLDPAEAGARSIAAASASGPGKRRTLAGRYV